MAGDLLSSDPKMGDESKFPKKGTGMTDNVLSHIRDNLIANARKLIIGYPSKDNVKATGLNYSMEYFRKEAYNESRSNFHRTNALIAYSVLSSERLGEVIMEELVPLFVDQILADGFENSGLKIEEENQAKNHVAVSNGKVAAKKVAVKAKTTPRVKATTTPKVAPKTTAKASAGRTAKKPAAKASAVKSK